MARKSTKQKGKKSLFKRMAIVAGKVLLWFFIFSIIWVIAYRFINPPITFLMVQRNWERKAAEKPAKIKNEWVKFEDISDNMKRAAVSAEDQLFLKHMGFDIKAIEKAYESNLKKGKKKIKGGSTISQQTAKNVFLWQGRSYFRKALEAYYTVLIELIWGKERILEVYLNSIEMGDGIYGAEAATQHWYKKECKSLTRMQAAGIAVILPNPRRFSPNGSAYISRKQNKIARYILMTKLKY